MEDRLVRCNFGRYGVNFVFEIEGTELERDVQVSSGPAIPETEYWVVMFKDHVLQALSLLKEEASLKEYTSQIEAISKLEQKNKTAYGMATTD